METEGLQDDFQEQIDDFGRLYEQIRCQVHRIIVGQEAVVEQVLTCLIASGHALLEGVPGLGKTLLVRTLSEVLDLESTRIQFTPDLMPADITGTNVLETGEQGQRSFQFQPGPVFANLVLADEINRATPKTQSALLEAMQERTVSAARVSHRLPEPFFVLATQNPIELEGTYPLPEAQLDRFLFKIQVRAPDREQLSSILERTTGASPPACERVCSAEDVQRMQRVAREVIAGKEVQDLVADLILATHPGQEGATQRIGRFVRFGASPRGAQAVLLAAKVRALVAGRANVALEDVEQVYRPALRHRVLLSFEGQAEDIQCDDLLQEAWQHIRQG